MGNKIKTEHKLEFSTLLAARKSWHANKNIKKGIKLTYNDLILLRLGNGILGDINITGLEMLKDIKKGKVEKKMVKKIAVLFGTRADYGYNRNLIKLLNKNDYESKKFYDLGLY